MSNQLPSTLVESIKSWTSAHREWFVSLTSELVRAPSINAPPTGGEKTVQQLIGHWFGQLGIEASLYELGEISGLQEHVAWRPGRNYGGRPNLVARLKGNGEGRSLVLSGHADTVGLADEAWLHPPFAADCDGERIYGLGAFDMKGGLASAMLAARCLQDLNISLAGDLYVESVVDEEFGGANGTLAGRLRHPRIDGAIIMEPTNLRLATSHRGVVVLRLEVLGKPGRSFSGEEVVNPAKILARMIQDLEEFNRRRNASRHQYGLADTLGLEIDQLRAGPVDEMLGTRVPSVAWATFWLDLDPDQDPSAPVDALASLLTQRYDPTQFRLTSVIPALWGSRIPDEHPLVKTVSTSLQLAEVNPLPITAPFACDGAMFNRHSRTPMLILGPEGGNAHAADEFVSVSSLQTLTAVLALATIDWCGMA